VVRQNPDDGIIPAAQVPSTAFDPATGRCVIAHSPSSASFVDRSAIYLYAPGKGFLVDVSQPGINSAFSGVLIPQASTPFTAADLAGNVIGHEGPSPAIPSATIPTDSADVAANFVPSDAAGGSYTAKIDLTTSDLTVGNNGQVQDASLGAESYTIDAGNIGHGFMQLSGALVGDPNAFQNDFATFYIIDQRHFVAIGNGLGNGGPSSEILFFDPQ
jgi:hypothetical protein